MPNLEVKSLCIRAITRRVISIPVSENQAGAAGKPTPA